MAFAISHSSKHPRLLSRSHLQGFHSVSNSTVFWGPDIQTYVMVVVISYQIHFMDPCHFNNNNLNKNNKKLKKICPWKWLNFVNCDYVVVLQLLNSNTAFSERFVIITVNSSLYLGWKMTVFLHAGILFCHPGYLLYISS